VTEDLPDPLALGERIVSILQHGQRQSTYKLATLSALIQYCVSHAPGEPDATLDVPIVALADEVMRLYWQQVLPFPDTQTRLRQSSQEDKKPLAILSEILRLREAVGSDRPGVTFASAQELARKQYERSRSAVAKTLRQYPLRLLQRLPAGGGRVSSDSFLYDDTWMDGSKAEIAAHGMAIRLNPGVGSALARLSGLLLPTLNVLWAEKVQDLNPVVSENVPDFAKYLFGQDRTALKRVAKELKKAFGPLCFYCQTREATEVDHVLPWSRVHLDSLANLVPACKTCNGDKSDLLPVPRHLEAALTRDPTLVDGIAARINWPSEYDRVHLVGRGLYSYTPDQTSMWSAVGHLEPFNRANMPRWLGKA